METRVTRRLAQFLVDARAQDLPAAVQHEARRSVLNWLGCSLGGCREDAIEKALAALAGSTGPAQATLVGRRERLDAANAAFINAMSANSLDFDDTHLRTVIHPSAPVAAVLFALAEQRRIPGAELLHAFALGVEAECRIGNAVSPWHYARGWHISSTCGVIGAAAAAGRLMKLDEQQMTWALGLAATQAAGLVENLGYMAKSLHIGAAAKSGMFAAQLAAQNFTASEKTLEGARGFARVFGDKPDFDAITEGLGDTWELLQNAYKPYPCGVVVHPVIDACLELRAKQGIAAAAIERIALRVNPLSVERADRQSPRDGLEAKLSHQHAAAVVFVYGAAGVLQYTDACVAAPDVVALRQRVAVQSDATMPVEAAHAVLRTRDGRSFEALVPQALGSVARPMSDAQLEAKFLELAACGAPEVDARALIARMRGFENEADAAEIVRRSAIV
ncbi:MAG: MmgE/PrpD family protein [Betaproteobacteria bacterium]|nr:MmgE/PrpD family protein [Betaproteobacteria bacterium]